MSGAILSALEKPKAEARTASTSDPKTCTSTRPALIWQKTWRANRHFGIAPSPWREASCFLKFSALDLIEYMPWQRFRSLMFSHKQLLALSRVSQWKLLRSCSKSRTLWEFQLWGFFLFDFSLAFEIILLVSFCLKSWELFWTFHGRELPATGW